MLIKELHIYGYGKFENSRFSDLNQVQVIFGENEAGKSTIRSFIQSILFGFPLKNQQELRYEPKDHTKYGGKLILEHPKFGKVIVERVKGKAQGDVSVFLEDGTSGGEELLAEILGPLDKSLFQSIYSFDIHGLQNVQRLKGEELNRFLFSASSIGSEKVMEALNQIEREMERLFKPNGTRPEINQRLAQLKQTDQKLKEAKAKNDTYTSMLLQLENTIKLLDEKRQQIRHLEEELKRKKEWNRIYPYLKKRETLLKQLEEIGDVPFPIGGLEKFQRLEAEMSSAKKKWAVLKERKENITKELQHHPLDKSLLEKADEILSFVEELPQYRLHLQKLEEEKLKINQLEQELEELFQQLGFELEEEKVLNLNLSFSVKDAITRLEQSKRGLQEKRKDLNVEEERIQDKLRAQEKWLADLEARRLSEKERNRLEKIRETDEAQQALLERIEWTDQQLRLFNQESVKKNKGIGIPIVLFAFVAISAIGLFFFEKWEMALGLILSVPIIAVILISQKKNKSKGNEFYKTLLREKERLEHELKELGPLNGEKIDAKKELERDEQLGREIEMEKMKLSQLEEQFRRLINSNEEWEKAWKETEQKLLDVGKTLYLGPNLSKYYLLDAFQLLEKVKGKTLEKRRSEEEAAIHKEKLLQFETSFDKLALSFSPNTKSYPDIVIELRNRLNEQLERKKLVEERKRKLEEIEADLFSLEKELAMIDDEVQRLFDEAKVSTKEQFFDQLEKLELRRKLLEQLAIVQEELEKTTYPFGKEEIKNLRFYPDSVFEEIEQKREDFRKEIENLEQERASLKHQIEILESGGTFTELLHQFHEETYEFQELGKKWAALSVAKNLLEKSMEKYKKEKLPALLQQATSFFQQLTNENYRKIYLSPDKDELLVERKDGMFFSPSELSQATKEQLYISLRFALAETLTDALKPPLIIDDGFVHFDATRLKAMMGLLQTVGKKRQVLFFTCHQHLILYFDESNVLQLNEVQKGTVPLH